MWVLSSVASATTEEVHCSTVDDATQGPSNATGPGLERRGYIQSATTRHKRM